MYLPFLLKDTFFFFFWNHYSPQDPGCKLTAFCMSSCCQLPCHLLHVSYVCPFLCIPPVTMLIKSFLQQPPNRSLVCVFLVQLCPALCDPKDCGSPGNPPGSSAHGILQARILECVAIFFSRAPGESSLAQRSKPGHRHCRQILYQLSR